VAEKRGTQQIRERKISTWLPASSVAAAIVAAIISVLGAFWSSTKIEAFRADLQRRESVAQVRWEAKRQACLAALEVVDAYFTTLSWSNNGQETVPIKGVQKFNIRQVRQTYNRLAVSVDNEAVLRLYKDVFQLVRTTSEKSPPIQMDLIRQLRNAIRKELFGAEPIEEPASIVWIPYIEHACVDGEPGCPTVETFK